MIRLPRRRARIEAATAAHLADLGKLRPQPFAQPKPVSAPVAEQQRAAWMSYWPNIATPWFVR